MPAEPDTRHDGTPHALPKSFRQVFRKFGAAVVQPVLMARSDSSHAGPGVLGKVTITEAVAQ